MLQYVYIASGGALGAVARYGCVTLTQHVMGRNFPYGTLLVNALGAFLIGLIMSLYLERFVGTENTRLFIVVGFLGGYTTFSSFTWETLALYINGQWCASLINLIVTNGITMFMTIAGVKISRLI